MVGIYRAGSPAVMVGLAALGVPRVVAHDLGPVRGRDERYSCSCRSRSGWRSSCGVPQPFTTSWSSG
ncbi:hypothetical protein HBB16_17295 [Pseudonocardia sp. MCCB 268]|nr:hypothetical protein [Pseudonocardia cytotoxica]